MKRQRDAGNLDNFLLSGYFAFRFLILAEAFSVFTFELRDSRTFSGRFSCRNTLTSIPAPPSRWSSPIAARADMPRKHAYGGRPRLCRSGRSLGTRRQLYQRRQTGGDARRHPRPYHRRGNGLPRPLPPIAYAISRWTRSRASTPDHGTPGAISSAASPPGEIDADTLKALTA